MVTGYLAVLQAKHFALANSEPSNPSAVHGVVHQGYCAFLVQSQCEMKPGNFGGRTLEHFLHVQTIQHQVNFLVTSSHLEPAISSTSCVYISHHLKNTIPAHLIG